MEEKILVIDEIVKRHPSFGVEKGWSCYTGGMVDSGYWDFRKMLDVPLDELTMFLNDVISEEGTPPPTYTEEEISDMKIIHRLPNGCFITEYTRKLYDKFINESELKMLGLEIQ